MAQLVGWTLECWRLCSGLEPRPTYYFLFKKYNDHSRLSFTLHSLIMSTGPPLRPIVTHGNGQNKGKGLVRHLSQTIEHATLTLFVPTLDKLTSCA